MESIKTHILDLKKKISVLLMDYSILEKKNSKLREENNKYQDRVAFLEEEVESLKKRVDVVNLVKGIDFQDGSSVDFARKRVNKLIREIDKCISLLNN